MRKAASEILPSPVNPQRQPSATEGEMIASLPSEDKDFFRKGSFFYFGTAGTEKKQELTTD
jgi:hypothetical protein